MNKSFGRHILARRTSSKIEQVASENASRRGSLHPYSHWTVNPTRRRSPTPWKILPILAERADFGRPFYRRDPP